MSSYEKKRFCYFWDGSIMHCIFFSSIYAIFAVEVKCISSDGHSLKVVYQHNCFQITVWTCLHSHVFSGLTTSNVQSTRNFSLQDQTGLLSDGLPVCIYVDINEKMTLFQREVCISLFFPKLPLLNKITKSKKYMCKN